MRFALISAFSCLFLCQCANIVPPNGGLKDTFPPKIITVEEGARSIRIVFDENVKISNRANFYCSPPLKKTPELKTKKNQVVVEGDWQKDKSYSLHFPSVIADYNEGNPIKELQIPYPSGTADTLTLNGKIINTKQNKAVKDIWAVLYSNEVLNRDSALFLNSPHYISKTDDNGQFSFPNLSNRTYWLFALADEDGNLKYNLPEESVGFYTQAIIPDNSIVEINLFNENASFDSVSTQKIDSTSAISKLIINSLPANHLVELLKDKKVVKRCISKTSLVLDSLLLGNYEIRIIKDENNNGVWDTGSLLNRRQAELIKYYPNIIQIRENWDLEISWEE